MRHILSLGGGPSQLHTVVLKGILGGLPIRHVVRIVRIRICPSANFFCKIIHDCYTFLYCGFHVRYTVMIVSSIRRNNGELSRSRGLKHQETGVSCHERFPRTNCGHHLREVHPPAPPGGHGRRGMAGFVTSALSPLMHL